MDKQDKCNTCKEHAVIVEQGQFYSCAKCWLKINKSKKDEKK